MTILPVQRAALTFAAIASLLGLQACSADVVGAAATTAELQATQVRQAKAQQDRVTRQIGAAMQAPPVERSDER